MRDHHQGWPEVVSSVKRLGERVLVTSADPKTGADAWERLRGTTEGPVKDPIDGESTRDAEEELFGIAVG